MPNPESERMDALSEALVRILRRLDDTDRRLVEIEKAVGIARAETPQPEPPPPAPVRAPQPPLPRAESPPPPPVSEPPRLETTLGLAWINRIGVITLAIGVAFGFKYAVDNAWIGPGGRVAMGVLAGLAVLGFADRTWRGGQKTYAQGISGLGLAILYLSFYASFGFYHLVEPGPAFSLMAVATAMAGALALRYDAAAIAALGLLGGYATPVLLSTGEDRPWVLFSWVLLLNLCALALARRRKWQVLEVIAFFATAILYGGWMIDRFAAANRLVAALFGFLYYALFATSETQIIFVVWQALTFAAIERIWQEMTGAYAAASLALVTSGLAIVEWRDRSRGAFPTFAAFWLVYWLWISDFRSAPPPVGSIFLFLTAAFLMFLVWICWRRRRDLLLLALNGAVYFGVCYDLLRKEYEPYLGLFAVAVAAAHLAAAFQLWRSLVRENRDTRPVLLALGIALTFLTLAAPIQFAGYRITMAWAVEVAALAWIGVRATSRPTLCAALAVFALVVARLDTVDAWMYDSAADYPLLGNARFLTFAVAAAAAWAASFWVRRGLPAAIFYLGGHYIMLWALILEALAWTARSIAPENLRSAQSAAVSILMACYAVLLVGAGVLYRSVINRVVGLGLIGVVAAKLYFYDVWLLVRIYRIAAFSALGALLLLTSYVYSRNRASIENWWNDRDARM